jgi:hypothetical protein
MKRHRNKLSKKKNVWNIGRFNLAEMLSRLPEGYKVEEIPASKPMGKEVW